MTLGPDPAIRVRVDPTNPGQFFACCGLLELADRQWRSAEGWFERGRGEFCLRSCSDMQHSGAAALVQQIARCSLTNVMTASELTRRDELTALPKKARDAAMEAEKKTLDALYREAPIVLHEPFNLRIDWFADERAGGSDLKTWAGQQSVIDIARGMKAPFEAGQWDGTPPSEWLWKSTDHAGLPFNFDANLGNMGSDLDVGFSFDPLTPLGLPQLRLRTRPLIELSAFVGLQRFRPLRIGRENKYRYSTWYEPLAPAIACAAGCGLLPAVTCQAFEFRLLYRTKYLKSFLPATPLARS